MREMAHKMPQRGILGEVLQLRKKSIFGAISRELKRTVSVHLVDIVLPFGRNLSRKVFNPMLLLLAQQMREMVHKMPQKGILGAISRD